MALWGLGISSNSSYLFQATCSLPYGILTDMLDIEIQYSEDKKWFIVILEYFKINVFILFFCFREIHFCIHGADDSGYNIPSLSSSVGHSMLFSKSHKHKMNEDKETDKSS